MLESPFDKSCVNADTSHVALASLTGNLLLVASRRICVASLPRTPLRSSSKWKIPEYFGDTGVDIADLGHAIANLYRAYQSPTSAPDLQPLDAVDDLAQRPYGRSIKSNSSPPLAASHVWAAWEGIRLSGGAIFSQRRYLACLLRARASRQPILATAFLEPAVGTGLLGYASGGRRAAIALW